MKILHLTLKKRWFDLIATGQKKREYRQLKPYWEKRLLHGPDGEPNEFDEVWFRNGYRKSAPFMRVKCENIALSGKAWLTPRHEEILHEDEIVIFLGPVLESRNYAAHPKPVVVEDPNESDS